MRNQDEMFVTLHLNEHSALRRAPLWSCIWSGWPVIAAMCVLVGMLPTAHSASGHSILMWWLLVAIASGFGLLPLITARSDVGTEAPEAANMHDIECQIIQTWKELRSIGKVEAGVVHLPVPRWFFALATLGTLASVSSPRGSGVELIAWNIVVAACVLVIISALRGGLLLRTPQRVLMLRLDRGMGRGWRRLVLSTPSVETDRVSRPRILIRPSDLIGSAKALRRMGVLVSSI